MRKILSTFITLICFLSNNIAFANEELCIALTNFSDFPVDFDSIVSPGLAYRIDPGYSATLSGDHMVGTCLVSKNDCAVSVAVLDGTYQNFSLIEHLPRGSHIIYKDPHNFYVDRNAQVKCSD
jgi:hypothetical protein